MEGIFILIDPVFDYVCRLNFMKKKFIMNLTAVSFSMAAKIRE